MRKVELPLAKGFLSPANGGNEGGVKTIERRDSKKCMIMANEKSKIQATTDDSQIVLYQPDESIRLEVKLEHDTVWLNRQQMAQLFGRDIKTIGKHINNALHEELASDPTGANFATIENSKNPTFAKTASIIVVIH